MQSFIIILAVFVAILLIIVVLIQKSKGGGLASGFSGANQIMGVRHTNSFIEKATWTLAAVIVCLSIASAFFGAKPDIETTIDEPNVEAPALAFPSSAPSQNAAEEVPVQSAAE